MRMEQLVITQEASMKFENSFKYNLMPCERALSLPCYPEPLALQAAFVSAEQVIKS